MLQSMWNIYLFNDCSVKKKPTGMHEIKSHVNNQHRS